MPSATLRLAAAVSLLALAGCAAQNGQPTTTTTTPSVVTTTTPAATGLALTATGVGTTEVGGSGAAAAAAAQAALGAAEKVMDGRPCQLGGETPLIDKLYSWGALTITTRKPDQGEPKLVGWTLHAGALPAGLTLPYDVSTATSVKDAVAKIPGAKTIWDDVFGMYQITTPLAPTMIWAGDQEDGSGPISYITNAFEPCD